jgi:nucleotide-binding universal stress UspA family protein
VIELSRVLCAVDFSRPARTAFARALALSRQHNAELTVVQAVPVTETFGQRGRARMARIAALRQAAETEGVILRVSVQHGDPAGVIMLHANARPFDLVVVGTHQRVGMGRLRKRSVAERVTQGVASPVLIVPAVSKDGGRVAVAPFGRVVCATDFERASTAALDKALPIAQRAGGHLTLVHVVNGVSPKRRLRYAWHFNVPEYDRLLAADAWRRLQESIPVEARKSGSVHARVVTGIPSDEIVRIADEARADLIVMGMTKRGAIGRRLIGSTAARVIRRAGCAVLAVPESRLEGLPTIPQDNSTTALAA